MRRVGLLMSLPIRTESSNVSDWKEWAQSYSKLLYHSQMRAWVCAGFDLQTCLCDVFPQIQTLFLYVSSATLRPREWVLPEFGRTFLSPNSHLLIKLFL